MIICDLEYLESIDDTSSVIGGTTSADLSGYLDNLFSNMFSGDSNITAIEGSYSTSVSSGNGDTIKVSLSTQGEGEAVVFAQAGDLQVAKFSS